MINDGFQLYILVIQLLVCCVLLLFAKLYFGQLGLAEKNILNCEFDPMHSDHSDANTNSTTLFSEDDTEEKSRRSSNLEISLSIPREVEVLLHYAITSTYYYLCQLAYVYTYMEMENFTFLPNE